MSKHVDYYGVISEWRVDFLVAISLVAKWFGGEMTVDLSKWWVKYTIGMNSGGSRPSDKGSGGGGRSSRPWDKGAAISKKIFWTLRASVWSKNRGAPGPAPGSATDEYRWIRNDLGLHSFFFLFHSFSVPQWFPFNVKTLETFLLSFPNIHVG